MNQKILLAILTFSNLTENVILGSFTIFKGDYISLNISVITFQITNSTSTAVISNVPGPPIGSEVVGSALSASELFLAFRIYEPFRNWR